MKYRVNVQGKNFEVEVNDIHSQPIIAIVDGDPVEVWVETHFTSQAGQPSLAGIDAIQGNNTTRKVSNASSAYQDNNSRSPDNNIIRSPIPGVITLIGVKESDDISKGQVLCVLEAMKMKNTIRSPRSGVISSVHIVVGQTVQHHDALVEFAD